MDLIDTHIHLDLEQFSGDLDDVIAASRAEDVNRWINVGFDPDRWTSTLALVDRIDGLSAMLGIHPGSVDHWSATTFDELARLARTREPVAIGEIGLDLYWRQDNLATQIEAFRAQLELAVNIGIPTVIHMRNADDAMLETLESQESLPHIHFHSFDGGTDLRSWVLDHGATIGVGGLITRNTSGDLRQWVADLDRNRVVLETDAPYLKPRGIRGMRNEPAYMIRTASLLAELWDTDLESIASTTTANAERIFGL